MDKRLTQYYHQTLPQQSLAVSMKDRIDNLADEVEKRYGSDELVTRLLTLLDTREAYIRCDQIEKVKTILGGELLQELNLIQSHMRYEAVLEEALFKKKKNLAVMTIEELTVISPRFVRAILTKIYEDEREHDDIRLLYGKLEEYDWDDQRNVMVQKAGFLTNRDKFWITEDQEDADE